MKCPYKINRTKTLLNQVKSNEFSRDQQDRLNSVIRVSAFVPNFYDGSEGKACNGDYECMTGLKCDYRTCGAPSSRRRDLEELESDADINFDNSTPRRLKATSPDSRCGTCVPKSTKAPKATKTPKRARRKN